VDEKIQMPTVYCCEDVAEVV